MHREPGLRSARPRGPMRSWDARERVTTSRKPLPVPPSGWSSVRGRARRFRSLPAHPRRHREPNLGPPRGTRSHPPPMSGTGDLGDAIELVRMQPLRKRQVIEPRTLSQCANQTSIELGREECPAGATEVDSTANNTPASGCKNRGTGVSRAPSGHRAQEILPEGRPAVAPITSSEAFRRLASSRITSAAGADVTRRVGQPRSRARRETHRPTVFARPPGRRPFYTEN